MYSSNFSTARPNLSRSGAGAGAGDAQSALALADELERTEQQITLTLQEIDHNFSRAHRAVTAGILPVVEQYAHASAAVWDGAAFWKRFFEASADVSLSKFEQGGGAGAEGSAAEGDADEGGGTEREGAGGNGLSESEAEEPEDLEEPSETYRDDGGDRMDVDATARPQRVRDGSASARQESAEQARRRAVVGQDGRPDDGSDRSSQPDDSEMILSTPDVSRRAQGRYGLGLPGGDDDDDEEEDPIETPQLTIPIDQYGIHDFGIEHRQHHHLEDSPTAGKERRRGPLVGQQAPPPAHHPQTARARTPPGRPTGESAPRRPAQQPERNAATSHILSSQPRAAPRVGRDGTITGPVMHRMPDRTYRVIATPHKPGRLDRPGRLGSDEDEDEDHISPPKLRPEYFGAAAGEGERGPPSNRELPPLARTPGRSLMTPGRMRRGRHSSRTPGRGAGAASLGGNTLNLLDDLLGHAHYPASHARPRGEQEAGGEARQEGDPFELDLDLEMDKKMRPRTPGGRGRSRPDLDLSLDFDFEPDFSPPKTMQFHVPQSRLLQTPAREASRRIMNDILLTAGAKAAADPETARRTGLEPSTTNLFGRRRPAAAGGDGLETETGPDGHGRAGGGPAARGWAMGAVDDSILDSSFDSALEAMASDTMARFAALETDLRGPAAGSIAGGGVAQAGGGAGADQVRSSGGLFSPVPGGGGGAAGSSGSGRGRPGLLLQAAAQRQMQFPGSLLGGEEGEGGDAGFGYFDGADTAAGEMPDEPTVPIRSRTGPPAAREGRLLTRQRPSRG